MLAHRSADRALATATAIGHSVPVLDLDLFCMKASDQIDEWAHRGVQGTTDRSPSDGRPKASASVVIDAGDTGGQLTVWDSGEGELEFFGADGRVTHKHFDDLTDDSARLALADLEAFLPEPGG
jgi:hypothetical protein